MRTTIPSNLRLLGLVLCGLVLSACSQEVPYETFYENGQLWWRENYTDGEQDGLSELFDEDGNLTKTETWENGEVVEYNLNP